MQGCKSAVGRTRGTGGAVHKSTEWLQFVYLIKYHFIEMHGAWRWARGLQRLGGCADSIQGIETHTFCGYCWHPELKHLPYLQQPIPSNSLNRAESISEMLRTKPRT